MQSLSLNLNAVILTLRGTTRAVAVHPDCVQDLHDRTENAFVERGPSAEDGDCALCDQAL